MYDDWAVVYREECQRYAEAAEAATTRELARSLTVDGPVTAEPVAAE
jgi:hypothetical protein